MVATMMVQINPPWPTPIRLMRKPPTKAPAIPMRIVTIMPPGSSPGMINFASAPAMSPIMIQAMIEPIIHSSFQERYLHPDVYPQAEPLETFLSDLLECEVRPRPDP